MTCSAPKKKYVFHIYINTWHDKSIQLCKCLTRNIISRVINCAAERDFVVFFGRFFSFCTSFSINDFCQREKIPNQLKSIFMFYTFDFTSSVFLVDFLLFFRYRFVAVSSANGFIFGLWEKESSWKRFDTQQFLNVMQISNMKTDSFFIRRLSFFFSLSRKLSALWIRFEDLLDFSSNFHFRKTRAATG